MKIVNRQPEKTADASSARGTAGREFWSLALSALVLLVAFYFLFGLMVDWAVSKISFETEARIFNAWTVPANQPLTDSEKKQMDQAQQILDKLLSASSAGALPYRLILLNNSEPNAFAFPGGTIGLTNGLLDQLDQEIAIAFVLAHELGHFQHRDHLQGMGRAVGTGILMTVIFGQASTANSFVGLIDLIFQRQYSQAREIKADQFALVLVDKVYGKTQGADKLFKILKHKDTIPGWAYMFSTHPSPEDRISDLSAYHEKLKREKSDP